MIKKNGIARVARLVASIVLMLALAPVVAQSSRVPHASALNWRPWSDQVFKQAALEHKFVLLDLEAVWCHWCHVMDEVTYQDPAVKKVLQAKYLLVKVDQDSRPDISNRYEDYGWPATVVFSATGQEIVKRQGYLAPKEMESMLNAIIEDPSPGPSVVPEAAITFASTSKFSANLESRLNKAYDAQYDVAHAGWGFGHKYLDVDSLEYALLLASHGDKQTEQRARDTLHAEQRIIDPVWGGAYQYSAGGDWDEPHFEKLISVQAQVLRAYSLAYAQSRNPEDLQAAEKIRSYVKAFLTDPSGGFYVSQDADLVQGEHSAEYFKLDDKARRSRGLPRVDKHLYARESGWMIRALCEFYAASGDRSALADAQRAATWVIAQREGTTQRAEVEKRSVPRGGFRHDSRDVAGPYLGDTLAMGQAFLSLYAVTGERMWLDRAVAAAHFITLNFGSPGKAGFVTARTQTDHAYRPHAERDENVQLARFANLLFQYTGNVTVQKTADTAMRYLATPEIALTPMAGAVLMAKAEFGAAPIHIAVVGPKNDAKAIELFRVALNAPLSYKRIEWQFPNSGAPARDDIHYPQLKRSAAFLCDATSCSSPIFTADALRSRVNIALQKSSVY